MGISSSTDMLSISGYQCFNCEAVTVSKEVSHSCQHIKPYQGLKKDVKTNFGNSISSIMVTLSRAVHDDYLIKCINHTDYTYIKGKMKMWERVNGKSGIRRQYILCFTVLIT
jgi:hypothetical protein